MHESPTLQNLVDEVEAPRKRTSDTWRIVVAGEFESGKSSAINALLRGPVLPCNPGLSARPAIQIIHGHAMAIEVQDRSGLTSKPSSLYDVADDPTLSSCHVRVPLGVLAGVEIVEVPFRHETGIAPAGIEMIADADLIIWVTIASQAWRLSEKSIIASLPYTARERSILAISRADKLRTAADLDKIETRLQKDASMYFSEIVFLQASQEKIQRAVGDRRAWEETGGAALASIAYELVVAPMNAAIAGAE